jgi:hypothetical protein
MRQWGMCPGVATSPGQGSLGVGQRLPGRDLGGDGAAFFWPIFPLLGWGIGVAFNAWDVDRPPISEDRIRREMDRLG